MEKIGKEKIKGAGVLLIALLMILSTVVVMADTNEDKDPIFIEKIQFSAGKTRSEHSDVLRSPTYLYYDGDTNVNAVGLTNGGTMEAAVRFTSDELTPYDGWELTTVRWHHDYDSEPAHDVVIKIYETTNPSNPGTPVTTESFNAPQEGWFDVPLSTPVVIDISNDYWIGIESTHLAGEFPHGVGPGPHVDGKGDWVTLNGGAWQSLYDASGGGLDYNWNIQAGLEEIEPFTANAHGPYEGIVGVPIQFTGSAENGVEPYSYSWDFGDGNTSKLQNPTHTYATADDYTVILTVTDRVLNTDDDETTATVTELMPLEANANGPYQGIVDEEIQFTGSATGGVPPYTYHWDFGNGDTSEEQNPMYAYDSADEYDVTLTVTDSQRETDDDVTTATVTAGAPELEIESITGGLGVTAVIKNTGETDAEDVDWSIEFDGGTIFLPSGGMAEGTVDIPAGEEVSVSSGFVLGFALLEPTTITVTASEAEDSVEGKIILFFVLI